jgi:hypothetical protein
MENEGYWFAVIKGDNVNIRFSEEKPDDDDFSKNNFGGTTFKLSELGNIPKGTEGTFYISREAGKMEMKGKFDNWMFVCDVCHDVCPWISFAKKHNEPRFEPN